MKRKKIAVGVSVALIILLVVPSAITVVLYNYHFNKRVTHENNYFEYLILDNPEFVKDEASFVSDEGQVLKGAFYYQEDNLDPQGLIIWVHGNGVSHENYLAEIQWFTQENYIVFAYDNTGVSSSGGDSLVGLTQAPIDLSYVLAYLDSQQLYEDIPHILIGHSWGGFAVSSVYALDDVAYEVDGIVSLAGYCRNVNVIVDIAKAYVGDIATVLSPFLVAYEYILFGEYFNLDGIAGLSNTNAPVLIIHSRDDAVVTYSGNYERYYQAFGDDDRFTFVAYEDAGHKLTILSDSYTRIHDIMHTQSDLEDTDVAYVELEEERLSLITDFNNEVMSTILEFCDSIVE